MVFIYIASLPEQIKLKFSHSQDEKDPKNYVPFCEVKLHVDDYNNSNEEQLYMHKIVGSNFIMDSDLQVLKQQWEEDHRPPEVLKEIKDRMLRCQDRHFITQSNKLTKGIFKEQKNESIKEYEKSVNFGLSFIFSIFASGLLGYYFGIYGLQLNQEQSYFLAILFLMGGLILETSLYIIKIMKDDKIKDMRAKAVKRKDKSQIPSTKVKQE